MQRSRVRKLRRADQGRVGTRTGAWKHAPIAAAIMAAIPRVHAETADNTGLAEVVVTAEKRTENLQDVPLSITAINTEKLGQLGITDFNDYVKFLPSVAAQSAAPGFARVFMRGVASGDNGNHSGPLPSVGTYLDEMPITTIQGALDVHIYDVERVEALAGPQGTLYGASSEAGTVRIITNKPDASGFKAGYDLQGDVVRGQGGYIVEGFANLPLAPNAAVRLVGWAEHDGGYIDNVPGTITYPTSGICIANTNPPPPGCNSTPALAKNRYNPVDTYGGRAALKVDLNDHWSITPALMGQTTKAQGSFGEEPSIGARKVSHYYPEYSHDQWWMAALTVEGKVANLDVTYAGGYLHREDQTASDYTDYSFFYDKNRGYGTYFVDPPGSTTATPFDPSQYILGRDSYRKLSHELRVATPKEYPLRFIGGLFYERQEHYILQNYRINQLGTDESVTGWPQTIWLTDQVRVDRDYAVFGELSYDLTSKLTGTVGYRLFRYDNSIDGFFGFGTNNIYGSSTGENAATHAPDGTPGAPGSACTKPGILGGPCVDLSNDVRKDGSTPKFNLTYKFDDAHMIYATVSRGFRPGGINRRTQAPPLPSLATYAPDYLKNYEIGWKSSWMDNHLRFNGAFFWEDWQNFQFSFLGQNSFTIVRNAGAARIKGVEAELNWLPMTGLSLTAGATLLDAKLTQDFCINTDANGVPLPLGSGPNDCIPQNAAPKGTPLPVTPKFKGNITARYTFPLTGEFDGHVQGAYVYQDKSTSQLAPVWSALIGNQDAYGLFDVNAGAGNGKYSIELFVNNVFDQNAQTYRYAVCAVYVGTTPICGANPYASITPPRTFGLRFGQRF
jgi:iron complex outermembrane receptor protein